MNYCLIREIIVRHYKEVIQVSLTGFIIIDPAVKSITPLVSDASNYSIGENDKVQDFDIVFNILPSEVPILNSIILKQVQNVASQNGIDVVYPNIVGFGFVSYQ